MTLLFGNLHQMSKKSQLFDQSIALLFKVTYIEGIYFQGIKGKPILLQTNFRFVMLAREKTRGLPLSKIDA